MGGADYKDPGLEIGGNSGVEAAKPAGCGVQIAGGERVLLPAVRGRIRHQLRLCRHS